MRFIYFDEVKYCPPKQPKHWIGAISVPQEILPEIEQKTNEIAERFFGSSELKRDHEFHAVDMIHGNSNFKGRKIEERLSAICELIRVVHDERIRRISISVIPANMVASQITVPEKAFMFLVEKCDHDLSKTKENGIMIGDLDGPYADLSVSNLSLYRKQGTPYAFGKSIDRIVDSVYFIPSHHTRMLQLADIYTYLLQLLDADPKLDTYPKKKIRSFFKEYNIPIWANSYKDWPTAESWLQLKSIAA